jgi:antitoxin (DNA-binding transcriptional repressor) of toxin-antitoxin stability system
MFDKMSNIRYISSQEDFKMTRITIRQLTHGFSGYLKAVKRGEKIVILERRTPVADLVPHQENLAQPGWRRPVSKIEVKGPSFSQTVSKMRKEER